MPTELPAWLFWVPLVACLIALVNFLLNTRWDRVFWLLPWKWFPRYPDVVVGVLQHDGKVLLVHRKPAPKSKLHWQFPAGQLGGERDLRARVEREVLSETGVKVSVASEIGRRRHPLSGKLCAYFALTYVSGEASNLENHENIYVAWVPVAEVENYFGDNLFPKVKKYLNL